MTMLAAAGPESGASVYLSCFNCHSLKAGVHLTGPSLSGLWGKPAGRAEGFETYSKALKSAAFKWDEKTLRQWLLNPSKVAAGTTMPSVKAVSELNVGNLIEFLKIAMAPGGYERVVREQWVSEKHATGQLQKDAGAARVFVSGIQPCGRSVKIRQSDGTESLHWEVNVAYRTDHSARGPKAGKPVLQKTGSLGDRFVVVFNSAAEIPQFVKPAAASCAD